MIRTHNRYYILAADGQTPVPVDDVREWALMFETQDRRVALTDTGTHVVSTVFLGLDHSFGENCDPLIWETMVFCDGSDVDQDRYSTYAEAVAGHQALVEKYAKP